MSTVLITGAASGLGKMLAETLVAEGYKVVGGVRKFPATPLENVRYMEMDVTDKSSIDNALTILASEGCLIDILIANAGKGVISPIECAGQEERLSFDTNFWGVIHSVQAVMPSMRAQGKGKIIAIGSLSQFVGLPCDGFYAASKAATEKALESFRTEVLPFGVSVSMIVSGAFKSNLFTQYPVSSIAIDDYNLLFEHCREKATKGEGEPGLYEKIEIQVKSILTSDSPDFINTVGKTAEQVTTSLSKVEDADERQRLINLWSGTEWWTKRR